MKILILCTGNSCRSQMAEGFIKSFDSEVNVNSAGIDPAGEVHPKAIAVMKEYDIDISAHKPKHVNGFLNDAYDYVITVCDNARENCPIFIGEVKHHLHIGFDDPSIASGTEEEILDVFRKVRDEIKDKMNTFYTYLIQ